ncbi:MAG: HD domain-containing protein [Clostridiales bacterium]|nr:HD domain-containing protein [Clostridiales bacterium]
MKEIFVSGLRTDLEVQDFFMVRTIAVRIGANKKQYLDLLLSDSTGEVTAKKWDVTDEELPALNEIKELDIIKVKALVTEWNGLRQLRVMRLRKAAGDDEFEFSDFIKSAPEKSEEMYSFVIGKANAIKDKDLKAICVHFLGQSKGKLLYYPAAQKNHHAELGGLLYHMKRMLMTGERVCEVYGNLNKDLVTAGVILHDIEKINEIDSNELGIASGYSFEGRMLGHIIQGIVSISKIAEELEVPKEKAIMLQHMILAHHYEPEFGSPKKPLFPEAEILHYLDMIDARMYDMQEALASTDPGGFSDRVWTLDNRTLYKAKG